MSISITWHGHSTFSLDINGIDVVVDPFFAGNSPTAKTGVQDVAADFILQTHGHFDHIADTLELGQQTGAPVITNFEICGWLNQKGHDKTHTMNTGGAYDFPFGRVKITTALHSSGMPDGTYGGLAGGFLLTTEGKKIYIAGDTALFSDMSLIGRVGLDLAILPIGDNYTMGPEDSILALEYLKPKVVIPCHYNTWPIIAIDIDSWVSQVREETDAEPVVPGVGESYRVGE